MTRHSEPLPDLRRLDIDMAHGERNQHGGRDGRGIWSRAAVCALVAGVLWWAGDAAAQQPPSQPSIPPTTPSLPPPPEPESSSAAGNSPDDALEAYLESLNLTGLRADFLLARLSSAPRDQRVAIAERLARLYVELLQNAATADERTRIGAKAEELLKLVPEADGFELRLNLAKALYLRAEDSAERTRMRLASADEAAQAKATLSGLEPQLRDIATRLHARVDALERRENSGIDDPALQGELGEARRLRSLAYYYTGWCDYYLAMLSGDAAPALEAMKAFGWVVGTPNNRVPSLDKLQPALLKYEHVARAALGCALCAALRGNDAEALRWVDAVDQADDLPPAVREQLLSRRIIVLASTKRWPDLELLIRRTRNSDRSGGGPSVQPLPVWTARLLAVVTLDADKRYAGDVIETLSKVALADLVARGEVAHVLDLVDKFGTTPIGERGFIVHYVRGVQAYDRARSEHQASQENPEEPAVSTKFRAAYADAADLLEAAVNQPDADQYRADRARAATALGRARFFAGRMIPAADAFRQAFEIAPPKSKDAEEALWLSILALERAIKGQDSALVGADKSTVERRDQTAALFLKTFPESDRAGRLLLMQISSGLLSPDDAVRVLANVSPDSALYPAARRQLARALYDRVRNARGTEREVASLKFLQVADEVLSIDRRIVVENSDPAEQKAAGERVVLLARQMLDALLSGDTPDPGRAQSVLETLEGVAQHQSLSLTEHQGELAFRRLQIHLYSGDEAAAQADLKTLDDMGPRVLQFIDAAERSIYRRSLLRYRAAPKDNNIEEARSLARDGYRVVERLGSDPARLADPSILAAFSSVAEAAFVVWKASGETPMRDLSIRLDQSVLGAQPRALDSLIRLSEAAESAGDTRRAIECWSMRLAAASTGQTPWFEARYNLIRLLAKVEPQRARAQLDQHKALYPDFGPEPFGSQIRRLDAEVAQTPTAPGPVGSTPGTGSAPPAPSTVPDGGGRP